MLGRAASDAIVMHCLPAYRGKEITSEVLDGPRSRVFEQAAARLPLQKAIMIFCLGKES
jgi:ornithine carbamoyltransferase